jgi:ppGpp synthetase/RelA/SpoT-type nucleotidyltranferase
VLSCVSVAGSTTLDVVGGSEPPPVIMQPEWSPEADEDMGWAEPKYTRGEVDRAGKVLATESDADWQQWSMDEWNKYWKALDVVNNWRASHSYPLNTFQVNLRHTARRFEADPLIAQRIKRLVSIERKLARFPHMKLSRMQDLGGCRVIVGDVATVLALVNYYQRDSNIKHDLHRLDDYIANPKPSGYRGVHLVYRYRSDRKATYNGLEIEMQLRSKYQHAWATAVETVDAFSGQALKSSFGQPAWERFFSLMGSLVALRERKPTVPGTPSVRSELLDELAPLANKLRVGDRLRGYAQAFRTLGQDETGAFYYLLHLDPSAGQLSITGFAKSEGESAAQRYAQAEQQVRKKPETDAVLVSVDSINALKRAYPNYFADTRVFLMLMEQALSPAKRKVVGVRVTSIRREHR